MTINLTNGGNTYTAESGEQVNGLGGPDRLSVAIADEFGDVIDGFLFGNTGKDILQGSFGRDRLNGGEGDDIIRGGGGRDLLTGGTGSDDISGGGVVNGFGGDTYKMHVGTIDDFAAPEKDVVRMAPGTQTNRNRVDITTSDYLGGAGSLNNVLDASNVKIFGFTAGDRVFLKYADGYDISYGQQLGSGSQLDTVISYQGDMVAIVADISLTPFGGSIQYGNAVQSSAARRG